MEEEEQPTETTSLFPAYVQHPPPQLLPSDPNKGASAASQWLQNTSHRPFRYKRRLEIRPPP
ncbi:UNVERIFIED_CONTAM: hypothetical protein Sradi_0054700 [Sesamum radiatum]|uniref:Uncharacterized protein n=1 Tax=Sesamum radiatum TaxID=300843 RepID=A0AAW2WI18_SESRA